LLHKRLTIILVPSEGQVIRRIRLRAWFAVGVVLLLVALGSAAAYFGQDYLRIRRVLPDVAQLEKENSHQRAQIIAFSQKIGQLRNEMEKLAQFNKKLKTALSISGLESDQFLGQGGPDPSTLETSPPLDRQRKEMIRQMHEELGSLTQEAYLAEQEQQELHAFLQSRRSLLAATPSIWPTRGWVTSGFGYRRSPFTGRKEFHKGLDIANRSGTRVTSPAAGVVAKAGWEAGYGRCITIHHGYGLSTKYAHLKKFLVKPGQPIKRGQQIAQMGSSGRSTGSHLHYEVRLNGVPVNPGRYLLEK